MKRFLVVCLIALFAVFVVNCAEDEPEVEKTISIKGANILGENIDETFWTEEISYHPHVFYTFYIFYEGNIAANDIQSVIINVPNKGDLNMQYLSLDTQNSVIYSTRRLYDQVTPNALPLGAYKIDVTLTNGNSSTYTVTVAVPGSSIAGGYQYAVSEENSTSLNNTIDILQKATNIDGAKDTSEIVINFLVDDNRVYNGYIWFYNATGTYLGISKMFRDSSTGNCTSIISNLYTDVTSENTVTVTNADITYQTGADFNQITHIIVVLTDGDQYASLGYYNSYDYRSVSEKTELTSIP